MSTIAEDIVVRCRRASVEPRDRISIASQLAGA